MEGPMRTYSLFMVHFLHKPSNILCTRTQLMDLLCLLHLGIRIIFYVYGYYINKQEICIIDFNIY